MAPGRRAGRDEAQRNVEENVHSPTGEIRGGRHYRGHAPGIEPDEDCQSSETATAQKAMNKGRVSRVLFRKRATLDQGDGIIKEETWVHPKAVGGQMSEVNSFRAAGAGD